MGLMTFGAISGAWPVIISRTLLILAAAIAASLALALLIPVPVVGLLGGALIGYLAVLAFVFWALDE